MAVEAHHLNLFSSQLISNNREIMMNNPMDASMNLYNNNNNNNNNNYSSVLPLSGTTTASETLLPAAPPYNSLIADSFPPQKTMTGMKSDVSTLTYNTGNVPVVPVSRKRSIDSINYPLPYNNKNRATNFSFLGEDISLQIHHQQLDVDHLVSQHMEKVRMELEEKRKRQARRLMEAIEIGVMKRLKSKEEEIEKIEKMNYALEERVKSLCIENQIWRDLAQTNEATANALRTNLVQVLSQVRENDDGGGGAGEYDRAAEAEDAESCCGSNDNGDVRRIASAAAVMGAQDKECEEVGSTSARRVVAMNNNSNKESGNGRGLCRNCGKEESCVLILPCRHLCLCTACGSTLHTCPICHSFKNASLHVNLT
ncbi:hypothetical protein RIF29_30732 [Crotalaria pallida]|uniref:RING-type domain-containing protein n=1 Tax=Crotalaria pallida TaxID=3830 RepID=A0AAN9EGV5_CROPI